MYSRKNRQVSNVNDFEVWRREQEDIYDGSVDTANGDWRTVLTGATFNLYEKSHVRIYGCARISPQGDVDVWSGELLRITLNAVAPIAPSQTRQFIYAHTAHEARQVTLEFRYTWKDRAGASGGTAYVPVLQVWPNAAGGDVWSIDPYMEIDVCRA